MTAFTDASAALPTALYAALKKVDLQLDNLINQAVPFKDAA
jgi:hypothetical protein